MKRTILYTFLTLWLSLAGAQQAKADSFFQLPIIPDSLSFDKRAGYLVEHYWDFCDLKKAFSSRQRMAQAFKEYIDLMPLTDNQKALTSIRRFVKSVEKQPTDLLFITQVAEEYMYSDTAAIIADHLYLPFVQAVVANKKIDKASKMRYERQANVIRNSMIGATAPDFVYVDRNGEKRNFAADTASVVILYVFDPSCHDCYMAKVRLHADVNTTKVLDSGQLKIVALCSTTPDAQWRESVADYPKEWIVGAVEDLDEIFDYRSIPSFYLLDNSHTIYAKDLDIDQLLQINREIAKRTRDPYINRLAKESADTPPTPSEN